VVALGSINLFEPEEDEFRNLRNIRSYLSCTHDDENRIFVDPFCLRGDRSRVLYSPVHVITPTKALEIDVTKLQYIGKSPFLPEFYNAAIVSGATVCIVNQSHFKMHPIHNYINGFLSLNSPAPVEASVHGPIEQIDGGRRRSKRRSKRKRTKFLNNSFLKQKQANQRRFKNRVKTVRKKTNQTINF
jgi:hypothetical protein